MAGETTPTSAMTGEVTITRLFDAPREKVWRAWTEPSLFAQWFGTPPYTTPESKVGMDVRPGGEWHATQVGQDGSELPFLGHYREVQEPERLVLTMENPEDPAASDVETVTVTLRDAGGKTEMTMRQQGHLPPEQYGMLKEGYSRFFDRMEELLRRL